MEMLDSDLWDKLNTIIGNRQQVYINQRLSIIDDIIINYNEEQWQLINSGSRAEGINLPGSDTDVMIIMTDVVVKQVKCTDADVVVDTRDIKPGFAKLVLGKSQRSMEKLRYYRSALTPVEKGQLYLSSLFFRDVVVSTVQEQQNSEPHGPCVSLTFNNKEFDYMVCLHCKEWPVDANEWITRHRINNWPSKKLIEEIVNEGFLLVPIGNPLSQKNHMEWRISFSVAEKKLVHSMNHTQIICYGLLKLYLKYVIEAGQEDCKGLLCSYFLKTALFYCIEQDVLVWDKRNLLNCFWACFKRLFAWVRQGYCPNYFIQTNNMFESKIYGLRRERLKEYLSRLYQAGIYTFKQIPVEGELIIDFGTIQLTNAEINELKCDTALYKCIVYVMRSDVYKLAVEEILPHIRYHYRTLACHQLSPVDYVYWRFWLLSCHLCLTQHLYRKILIANSSNSSQYKQFRLLSKHILRKCTGYDLCTGLLMHATLHYLFGKYRKVVSILEDVLKKFRSFVLYFGHSEPTGNFKKYSHQMCCKGYSIKQKINSALAVPYECVPNCNFYPAEIQHEVKQHTNRFSCTTFIPPKVYTYVLLFLTYHKTGNTEIRNRTLYKLIKSANSYKFIGTDEKPLASALVDRCLNIATTSL